MSNTNLKFKDIPIGEVIFFNGQYAIKLDSKRLHVTRLGVDGFMEIDENTELQIVDEDEKWPLID